MHCSPRLIVQTLVFSRSYLHRQVSPPETLVVKGGSTWGRNGRWILPENARLPRNIQGSFTCRKSTTWGKRLYFPSEVRRASAGFDPANFSICRPPKPLQYSIITTHVVATPFYDETRDAIIENPVANWELMGIIQNSIIMPCVMSIMQNFH